MNKLLSANFMRLKKDRFFWLCMGVMLIYAVVYMLNGCRQATVDLSEYNYSIDKYYFQFAISIGAFCALFSSMFFGTEYSDGTIRNKIIVGHTRTNIYIANLITTFTATLLMMSVWLIGALVAVPTLGVWEMGTLNLLVYLLIAVMFVAAFSSIFTFVNMLSANKAVTVAVCLLLFLGLLIFSGMLYNALCEPEMASGVIMTANGIKMADPTPNPKYISGMTREIYDFMVDFLPAGQGLKMWQLEIANPLRMLASSVFITVLTTVGGIFAIKRKNIK